MKIRIQIPGRVCVWIAVLLLAIVVTSAQETRFRTELITTRDGLSQSIVYAIMQDSHGFMWFGTRDGLDRYDGYGFRSYRYDPIDTTTLSSYLVQTIAEDSSGHIWAGTFDGGLSRLDRRTGKFTRFRADPSNPNALASSRITSLVVDRCGWLWVASTDGNRATIHRFDERSGRMIRYGNESPGDLPRGTSAILYVAHNGHVWVCTSLEQYGDRRRFLSHYQLKTNTFTTDQLPFTFNELRVLGEDAEGCLIVAAQAYGLETDPVVLLFDPVSRKVRSGPLLSRVNASELQTYCSVVALDASGECWLSLGSRDDGNDRSLYCVRSDRGTNGVPTVSGRLSEPLLAGIRFSATLQSAVRDRSGTMWLGTSDGVWKVSRVGGGFDTWKSNPFDNRTLSSPRIRSILVDRGGTLWVGTDQGLNRKDPSSDTWRRYAANGNRSHSLPSDVVNVICELDDKSLLFGTHGGLVLYDREHDRFSPALKVFPQRLEGFATYVWSLLRDRSGRLWIGTSLTGLALCDSGGRRITWYRHTSDDPHSILGGAIWSLLEDSRGAIWIGTNEGLCRWDPETNGFKCYQHVDGDRRSLGGMRIWSLLEDSDGNVWAGSYGGGISRYNRATDDFTTITARDGLTNNSICSMLEDDAGNFWIGTTSGLVQWNRKSNHFHYFDERDGLAGSEFALKAAFKGRNGVLYFGGTTGLTAFNPSTLTANPYAPTIAITGFRIYDSLVTDELFSGDTVWLDHATNYCSFEFAALDYLNSGKNRYEFQLDGFDPRWFATTSDRRVATYTDLDPGTYTFRVRASNNSGVWNRVGIAVTVIVRPPWWKLWWVELAAALLVVGGSLLIVRARYRAIRLRIRDRREAAVQAAIRSQEEERERIARDLHDGVGQLLAAARINVTRLYETLVDPRVPGDERQSLYERAVSTLSRAGNDVRAISHALGVSTLREMGLTVALAELLANVSAHESTRFQLIDVGMEMRLPPHIELELFRIAQELISNIIHHAGACEATVQLVREGSEIRLTVEDDGIGYEPEATVGGMGRRNIAERAEAIGARLDVDSTPGHGTTVTVTVTL